MKRLRLFNLLFLFLIAFLLPFSIQEITYFIGFWALSSFFVADYKQFFNRRRICYLILPIALFLMAFLSVYYSENKDFAWKNIQLLVNFLLFPVFVFLTSYKLKEVYPKLLFAFLLGLLVYALLIILKEKTFFDIPFQSKLFKVYHPTYVAVYFNVGLVFLFELLKKRQLNAGLFLLGVVIFSGIILVLNSRAGLLILFLLAGYYLSKYFIVLPKIVRFIFIFIFTLFIVVVFVNSKLSNLLDLREREPEKKNENVLLNSDFNEGLLNWNFNTRNKLTALVEKTDSQFLLVYDKLNGDPESYLLYRGPELNYYKNVLYTFRIKYKVVEGDSSAFKIGWTTNQRGRYVFELKRNDKPLGNDWFEATFEYFNNTELSLNRIYLYQKNETIVLYDYIKLSVNDLKNRALIKKKYKDIRVYLWKNGIELFCKNLIFGVGIGDGKNELLKIHQKNGNREALRLKYNAHNQFVETSIQLGLIGLMLLLAVFIMAFILAIRLKREPLALFMMIFFLFFMVESVLLRFTGVLFFSFWYSVLIFKEE